MEKRQNDQGAAFHPKGREETKNEYGIQHFVFSMPFVNEKDGGQSGQGMGGPHRNRGISRSISRAHQAIPPLFVGGQAVASETRSAFLLSMRAALLSFCLPC